MHSAAAAAVDKSYHAADLSAASDLAKRTLVRQSTPLRPIVRQSVGRRGTSGSLDALSATYCAGAIVSDMTWLAVRKSPELVAGQGITVWRSGANSLRRVGFPCSCIGGLVLV